MTFSDTEKILVTWKVVHKSVGHLIHIKKISEEKYVIGDSGSINEAKLRAMKAIEKAGEF